MGTGHWWQAAAMLPAITGAVLCAVVHAGYIAEPPTRVPQADTCTVDPDGTEHITRVVPVPGTISPEAQKYISRR
jgi:epsilon-lactone hydrolase